jgi:hypothetical protein
MAEPDADMGGPPVNLHVFTGCRRLFGGGMKLIRRNMNSG